MDIIKMDDGYSLAVDVENKRLRLIVLNGDNELVCHKTTVSEVNRFLQQADAHLFKGRLQLDKTGDRIAIMMKGAIIGSIHESEFAMLLSRQDAPAFSN